MKNKVRRQNGFAASDALIAVLIITLFAGLIASISYNIYLTNSSVKRMSKATNYIVDMFEYIDKIYYDDVTIEKLTSYFNNKYYYEEDYITAKSNAEVKVIASEGEEVNTPFKVELILVNYNETEGNKNKIDLVKEITMKVTYKLGNKDQTIEMKRTKQRENLDIPNKPNLSLFELQEGEIIYPIKNTDEGWMICNSGDQSWYNYETGNWAIILKTNKNLSIDEKIYLNSLDTEEAIYGWIPRYAYDGTNNKIEFLYRNTNKTVKKQEDENGNEYNNLLDIDESLYSIPEDFKSGDEETEGIWTNDITTEVYKNLNNVYPLIL